jgi:exonuclease SbcD
MSIKVLHFADAHIDMANFGRHDPQTGLPVRVMDYLKSLDTIVDTAIDEKVDLVLFAGDAYKDRNPAPTFQREWDSRIMRLSQEGIQTVILVGNHDMSPGLGRAHALTELKTLAVPNVTVVDRPLFLKPEDLNDLNAQILAIPWISRSGMLAYLDIKPTNLAEVYIELEERLIDLVDNWLSEVNENLPTILTAHATVQGATYGGERSVMLGGDLVLSGGLVKNPKLDYVALGHIHKPQNLNKDGHPPVVYSGSIERVDFGEVGDRKYFVIATLEKGKPTEVEWRELTDIRKFIDLYLLLESDKQVAQQIAKVFPARDDLEEAIVRLVLEYPRDWEGLIDEAALREMAAPAFEFQLVKRPQIETRVRLPADQTVGSLSPIELLKLYWESLHTDAEEVEQLLEIAENVIQSVHGKGGNSSV